MTDILQCTLYVPICIMWGTRWSSLCTHGLYDDHVLYVPGLYEDHVPGLYADHVLRVPGIFDDYVPVLYDDHVLYVPGLYDDHVQDDEYSPPPREDPQQGTVSCTVSRIVHVQFLK